MRQVGAAAIAKSLVSRGKGYTDGLVQFGETQHTSLERGDKAREGRGDSAATVEFLEVYPPNSICTPPSELSLAGGGYKLRVSPTKPH